MAAPVGLDRDQVVAAALDVPVATYRGEFTDSAGGHTSAFDRRRLAALYPTHDS